MARTQPLFALLDDEPEPHPVDRRTIGQREEVLTAILDQLSWGETSGARLYEIAGEHWLDDVNELKQRGHAIDCRQIGSGWLVNLTN